MRDKFVWVTIVAITFLLLLYPDNCFASYKVVHTRVEIEVIENAVDKFYADTGRYPTMAEGLEVLRQRPSQPLNWRGPYLKKDVPVDPWRRPYIYIYPAKYGTKQFDLYSWGADGKDDFGLVDDISNWRGFDNSYYKIYSVSWWSISFVLIIFLSIIFFLYSKFWRKKKSSGLMEN